MPCCIGCFIVLLVYIYLAHTAASAFVQLQPRIWNVSDGSGRPVNPSNVSSSEHGFVFSPRAPRELGECATDELVTACSDFVSSRPWKLVHFMSRTGDSGQDDVRLAAWWLPAERPDAPRIIVQNGCCRHSLDHTVQIIGSCLLRSLGYSVLAPSYREMGLSDNTSKHYYTWGHAYHYDVLGALDYAVADPDGELGGPGDWNAVGLMGFSMGGMVAGTVFGMEPRLPGVWLDGGMLTVSSAMHQGIVATLLESPECPPGTLLDCHGPFSRWLAAVVAPLASRMTNWVTGVDLMNRYPESALTSPQDASCQGRQRAVALLANRRDETVTFDQAEIYKRLFQDNSDRFDLRELWVEQFRCGTTTHCNFHAWRPEEYRRRLRRFWGSVFDNATHPAIPADDLPPLPDCPLHDCPAGWQGS